MNELTLNDFADIFDMTPEGLSEECTRLISQLNFRYRILKGAEREKTFLRVIKTLNSDLELAGKHRLQRWEDGWAENLQEFVASGYDTHCLVPKFVKNQEVIRFRGDYILPEDSEYETNFVRVLRAWIIESFFTNTDIVCEFGCGTAHNLVDFARINPSKLYYGLDWALASQEIIRLLREKKGFNILGQRFDLFNPDIDFKLPPNSGVLTVGTLEQMGTSFGPFLSYLLSQSPSICVHMETLYEYYNQDNLFDYVAAQYLEKRHYLKGFIKELKKLEADKFIEILSINPTFGSLYHDGYTVLAWRPL